MGRMALSRPSHWQCETMGANLPSSRTKPCGRPTAVDGLEERSRQMGQIYEPEWKSEGRRHRAPRLPVKRHRWVFVRQNRVFSITTIDLICLSKMLWSVSTHSCFQKNYWLRTGFVVVWYTSIYVINVVISIVLIMVWTMWITSVLFSHNCICFKVFDNCCLKTKTNLSYI